MPNGVAEAARRRACSFDTARRFSRLPNPNHSIPALPNRPSQPTPGFNRGALSITPRSVGCER